MKKKIGLLAVLILAICILIPAGCSAKKYVVTYETAGGTVAEPSISVSYGKMFVLDVPSRDDATFLGWFRSADEGSEQITDEYGKSFGKYTEKTDSTVYAKWSYWDTEGLVYELTTEGDGYIVFAPDDFTGTLIKVPDTYQNKPVVRVGSHGFSDLSKLEQVVLPESIVSIGSFAFEKCTELTAVDGATKLEKIEERAFYHCTSLLSFRFSENTAYIGKEAFSGCTMLRGADFSLVSGEVEMETYAFSGCTALSSVTLPEYLEDIPQYAFTGCSAIQEIKIEGMVKQVSDGAFSGCTNLRSLHIGARLTTLGDSVFTGSTYLREITVDEQNTAFTATGNILFDKSESVLYRYAPYQEGTTYRVPDTVTRIREGAFSDVEFCTELYVGTNVRQIDAGAFSGMQYLASITIPFVGGSTYANTWFSYIFGGAYSAMTTNVPYTLKEVTVLTGSLISERAFQFCNSLTSITLPDTLTAVGAYAFYGCASLTELVLPAGVSSVGEYALMACTRLQSIAFDGENDYYSTENGLLYDKEKTTLLLYPAGKTDTEFTVPETVTKIADNAFYYASRLRTIILPANLQTIGNGAFLNCRGLVEIVMPSALESIGDQAFASCTNLTTVSLSENISEIGRQIFYGCVKLETVSVAAAQPPLTGDSIFLDTNEDFEIIFESEEQRGAYLENAVWSDYDSHFTVKDEEQNNE